MSDNTQCQLEYYKEDVLSKIQEYLTHFEENMRCYMKEMQAPIHQSISSLLKMMTKM